MRTALARTAAVGAIGAAMLTGSAAIASAQTATASSQSPLITCVLHTQNRGVVFSQLTYGDCFQLMYASPQNRPDHHDVSGAATWTGTHDPAKWTGAAHHSSASSDQK